MITRTIRLYVALSEPYPDAPCNYYHRESGGRYPALPAAQSMTIPMLHTILCGLYGIRLPRCSLPTTTIERAPKTTRAARDRRGQKKPAPNAEANEAGHGPKAARIKQLANHETNLHEHRHKEGEAAKQGQVAEHRCPAYQPLPKNNAHKSSGFQYT